MRQAGVHITSEYDHDVADAFSRQEYFPDALKRESYYHPVERGFERELKKRLDYFKQLRLKKKKQ